MVTGITGQEGRCGRIYLERREARGEVGIGRCQEGPLEDPDLLRRRVGSDIQGPYWSRGCGGGFVAVEVRRKEGWIGRSNDSDVREKAGPIRNISEADAPGLDDLGQGCWGSERRWCCLIQTHEPQKPPAWESKD